MHHKVMSFESLLYLQICLFVQNNKLRTDFEIKYY